MHFGHKWKSWRSRGVCNDVSQITESGVNRDCWDGCWRWRRWEEAVTSCSCKHEQLPASVSKLAANRLSPPVRGWKTAKDTPSHQRAPSYWIRKSRPHSLRVWRLPWQQRQWSPGERSLMKGRRFRSWGNAWANWRRRKWHLKSCCQVESEWRAAWDCSVKKQKTTSKCKSLINEWCEPTTLLHL